MSLYQVQLVYRGAINRWNHYESFLFFLGTNAVQAMGSAPLDDGGTSWWSIVKFDGGSCVALKTRPDGSCMFSAMTHQLFGSDIDSVQHMDHTTLLRRQVVDFLRCNRNTNRFQALLQIRMAESYPSLKPPYSDTAYDTLLDHLLRPYTWGGTECFTASSELFQCTIKTIWEGGSVTEIKPTSAVSTRSASIVYRRNGKRWVHYDSFLCFEELRYNDTPSVDIPLVVDLTPPVLATIPSRSVNGVATSVSSDRSDFGKVRRCRLTVLEC